MSSCQRIAEHWKIQSKKLMVKPADSDEDLNWKALTLLTDAYGEWGEDGKAIELLQQGLCDNPQRREEIASAVRRTGRALAADRSTKFFPIVVAQAFFIGAVGIAIFRTASAAGVNASSDTVFINVEAHSIAYTALYFWIIPAVFLSSIIGVSQTEAAIPRILRRFEVDIKHLNLENEMKLPNECLNDNEKRIFHGGIYSWVPQSRAASRTYLVYHNVLPYVVMIIGTATGMAVSALVPPDGWDCRHNGQILIFIAWLLSAQVDGLLDHFWPLNKNNRKGLFWIVGIKDLLFTIATMGGVITTQVGVFNRCSCYTLWGRTGLALPEMPHIAEILFHRLSTAYPAITFVSIGIELIVIPLLICIRYRDALRTFLQRDDRKSNAGWLWKILKRYRTSKAGLRPKFPRNISSVLMAKKTGPLDVELQHLAPNLSGRSSITREDASAEGTSVADEWTEAAFAADSIFPLSAVDPPSRIRNKIPSRSESRERKPKREDDLGRKDDLARNLPAFLRDSAWPGSSTRIGEKRLYSA